MLIGVIALFTIILNVQGSYYYNPKELKLVHILFRHGIRTPADTYPNDPYLYNKLYPVGWGQITNQGKLGLYKHGKFLRQRYGEFLGTHYSSDIYYVQTTDVDRTKVTAQCINAGLWPPSNDQKWGPLDWQPIPIHAEPLKSDSLLLVRRPCAQYSIELERLLNSPEIRAKLNELRDLRRELQYYTGKEINNFEDIQDVYTTFLSEESYNLTLPSWTRNLYPHKLLEPSIFSFVLNAYNDKLNRLKGGVFLRKLINDWKSVADGTITPKERKAFLYVGHDSTIVNLLSTLKVWDPQIPGFAINVLMELSRDLRTGEYGLELFLRNSTVDAKPIQLTIPNCNAFCPLSRLIELTNPVVPRNWKKECQTDDPNYVVPPPGGP